MSDLATSHPGHTAGLAHREWREVVVQHKILLVLALITLNPLHVIGSAEGGGDKRLGLSAGEESGAVSPWQHAGFNADGTDLIKGAGVGTLAILGDLLAEDALAHLVKVLARLGAGGFVIFRNRLFDFFLQRFNGGVALFLGIFLGI